MSLVTANDRHRVPTWSNWSGVHRCTPQRFEHPRTETQVQELVAEAASAGLEVRPVGAGHSFSPLATTDGMMLDVRLDGDVEVRDGAARIPGGRRLGEVFEPLWAAGTTLRNMGELDNTAVTGAIATGVHGTGLTLPSISASVREARLVTGTGDVLEVGLASGDLFRAAKQSLGVLGVTTEVVLDVVPAYDLEEQSFFMTPGETLERWDELLGGHRHFSFYYLPTPAAVATYANLIPPVPDGTEDVCFGTVRDARDPDHPSVGPDPLQRRDRMNRILTYTYDVKYREIEYAVPLEDAKDVFIMVRDRLRDRYPDYAHPVDVRFVAQDDAFLSWCHDGPKAIFSVPDTDTATFEGVLADLEQFFISRGGLPHWGKEHTVDGRRFRTAYPGWDDFDRVRRELDPNGLFLNPSLAALFDSNASPHTPR